MTKWHRKRSNRPNQGQQMKAKKRKKGLHKVKTHSKELKRTLDIRFCHKKLKIYLLLFFFLLPFETMVIMAHCPFLTHMNVKKLKLKIYFIQF
jgi:hypothetical protein